MKPLINHNILLQTDIESSSLTVHGMIIHRFQDTGDFQILVYRKDILDKIIHVNVTEESKEIQLNIDLASTFVKNEKNCNCKNIEGYKNQNRIYKINPNTNVVFYVSAGSGGYYITAIKIDQERKKIFDSRELKNGDIFVVNLLRPGKYSMTNAINKSQGQIIVSYPKIEKTRYVPPEAISIECNKTFSNTSIMIQPAQGIVFRIFDNSRIAIKLEKPDDGQVKRTDKIKWVKLKSMK
ncbi:MAG: hypothetical protein WCB31_00570 [Nitrososphaeraceae archaeon]